MIIVRGRDMFYYDLLQKEIKKMLPEGSKGKVYEIAIKRTEEGFKVACRETGGRVKQGYFQLVSELRRIKNEQ